MATQGKSRGQNWSEHEIQALVSFWSEEGLQRQLKKSVRNDLAYARISRELAERGYIRTAEQFRRKVKSLKTRYKKIVDRLRRSGTGRESDEESEVPSDFSFFEDIDAVVGGRASVTPVHLLDSADAPEPSTSSRTSTPVPADSRTSTPVPLESRTSTPDPYAGISEETSCLSPAQPETSGPPNIHKDTSGPSQRHSQPSCTFASHMEPSTVSHSEPSGSAVSYSKPSGSAVSHSEPSGTPISKKKCKRPNKLFKAEASARALIHNIVEGQEKAKRCREELEERRLKQEEKMAAEERERDRTWHTSRQHFYTFSHGNSAARTITASTSLPLGTSANILCIWTTPSYHSCITWEC